MGIPDTLPPAEKSSPSSVNASPLLEMPSVLPARIRESFTRVRLLAEERMKASGSSARAASRARRDWNSASLFRMASMVHSMRSRLSLRFWMAAADISWEVRRATINTIVPNTQKMRRMERGRESLLRRSRFSVFSFMLPSISIPRPKQGGSIRRRDAPRPVRRIGSQTCCLIIPFSLF